MAKSTTSSSATQILDNPTVLIRYDPEKYLVILGSDAKSTLGKLQGAKVTSVKTMEATTEIIHDGEVMIDRIEAFRATLTEKVQAAAQKFRDFPGFEDFEITVTIKKWSLRTLLDSATRTLKGVRANYLAEEKRKADQIQADLDAKQRKINEKAANDAAKAAKTAGADKDTVREIERSVQAAPAPLVASRAVDTAKTQGIGLQFTYSAKITNLRQFLTYVLTNEVMFNNLNGAIPEIEAQFRKMAVDQKERFAYPGITFNKKPFTRG